MTNKYLNATTMLWAFLHVLLILVGLLLLNIDGVDQWLGPEVATGLGVSVMAAGVVGLFLFFYVAVSDTTRSRLKALNDAGVTAVFNSRSVRIKKEYDTRLKRAKRIDVVGYGLGSLLQDYAEDFHRWSRQSKVRIVAVDPDAPGSGATYADTRDVEEGRDAGRTRADVELLIRTIAENSEIKRENFELRLMSSIPSVNVMIIDDEILWGPYLLKMQSRNTFTMVVRKGGFMFDALESHFQQLWDNHSTPAPVDPRR